MTPEFDYQQRAATADYREGWERLWGEIWRDPDAEDTTQETYNNGCPILDDSE